MASVRPLNLAGKCASLTRRLPLTRTLIVDEIMRHSASNGSRRFVKAGAFRSAANARDADAKRRRLSTLPGLPKLRLADAVHTFILTARPRTRAANLRVQPLQRGIHRCDRNQASGNGEASRRRLAPLVVHSAPLRSTRHLVGTKLRRTGLLRQVGG